AGDLENGLGYCGCNLRNRLIAYADDPFVIGLEELDVDLGRIVRHAGNLVLVEIALDRASILDGDFLPHRVTERPRNLALYLLTDRKGIYERDPLIEDDIDALKPELPVSRDRNGHHVSADGNRRSG